MERNYGGSLSGGPRMSYSLSFMKLPDAYAWCRAVVARSGTNFGVAIRLLPKAKRDAICAIYAHCRIADDIADGGADRSLLTDEHLRLALDDVRATWRVPREHLDAIVDGCTMDLEKHRYASFDELVEYCKKVASAVGLACLHVFGFEEKKALAYAEELGIAMQLTNIIRDVKEDAARGRIYLPAEELKRFGVSERDVLDGRFTPAMKAMLAFQVARARAWFTKGRRLLPLVHADSRKCPAAIATVYEALLDRVEASGHDVFTKRVRLTAAQKLKVLASALK